MIRSSSSRFNAGTMVVACIVALAAAAPAHAYYGYNYGLGTGSWVYRALFGAGALGRAPYSSNPFYLVNSAIGSAGYAAQTMSAHRAAKMYYDPEPVGAPRQRSQPVIYSPYAQDQIAPARWQMKGAATSVLPPEQRQPQQSGEQPPADFDPNFMPVPQTLAAQPAVEPTTIGNAADMPPTAPHFPRQVAQSGQGNPLATAFIDHVNKKYDGNISRALKDRSTRQCASALGLVGSSEQKEFDLSQEKLQTIKNVLSDPQEDALTKISAVRMLLKH